MPASLLYDVGLGEDGDLPIRTRHITGLALIVQRVTRRLRTVTGEWLGDRRVGLPYFTWLQQKPPQVAVVGAFIRRAIETTPGVVRVDDWSGSFATATRTLSFSGTVITTDGEVEATIFPLGEPGAGNHNPSMNFLIRIGRIVN